MTDTLTQRDFCQHEPWCHPQGWLECVVSDYETYNQALHWLWKYRHQARIFVCSELEDNGERTGRYVFRFRCEQEYILFALKWSGINGRQ